MPRPRALLTLSALLCAIALSAPLARAATPGPTADCQLHNRLTRHYPVAVLEHALATMPAEISEYTSCYTVIQDQLNAQLGRTKGVRGTGGDGGGSLLSTPVIIAIAVVLLGGGGLALVAQRRAVRGG
jgi:hypothetical protein